MKVQTLEAVQLRVESALTLIIDAQNQISQDGGKAEGPWANVCFHLGGATHDLIKVKSYLRQAALNITFDQC